MSPKLTEQEFDKPQSLLVRTRQLIKRSDKSISQLVQETGLAYPWLMAFANGRNDNPSVNRVQFLYEYLNDGKLEI